MSDEQAAPETSGVTTEVLATVDLGPEIEGMAGRELRMRMVTMAPGGVYGPGVGWPEDRNTTHWLENRGTVPAVEVSVDIVRRE